MSTRVILTIQEEVECALCGRHLLRGERPDLFNVDGSERIVCELCGPRALSWGWERGGGAEPEPESAGASSRRERRGGLRGLLRRSGRGGDEATRPPESSLAPSREEPDYSFEDLFDTALEGPAQSEEPDTAELAIPGASESLGALQSLFESEPEPASDLPAPSQGPVVADQPERPEPRAAESSERGADSPISDDLLRAALEAFNAGEYPERVAGIARLLGAPSVAVRRIPEREGAAWITVAWEICWHRYEVDAGAGSQARRVAEGMELAELPELERESNAVLDEHGELQPIAA